jgi:TatD DNase family protein
VGLIDSHVHLQAVQFEADREQVLARAHADGVRYLINVGYDLPSSAQSVELAQAHPSIFATAGIQPHHALTTGAEEIAQLRVLLDAPRIVALGEIGLDYYHDRAPRPDQARLFEEQLALAAERRLPVVIHSRDAQDDTVAILSAARHPYPVIMHSFSGDWAYAQSCLAFDAFLSFSGPLTFPRATELHEVAMRAPLDRVLVETDCPYLSPHPFRGKRNEPARVRLVAERWAALRGIPFEEAAAVLWRNTVLAFGLPVGAWSPDDHAPTHYT